MENNKVRFGWSIVAALIFGGASWLLSEAITNHSVEFFKYGFYISYAAAALGLVFGIIVSMRAATWD